MRSTDRRSVMRAASAATLALAAAPMLSPRDARAQGVAPQLLTAQEVAALEAVGECLVPGAREDGIANFIDRQCSVPPHASLLGLRFANAPPPFIRFYRNALGEIDRQSLVRHGRPFQAWSAAEQYAFVDLLRQGRLPDWRGAPQGQIYRILRDDAVDVVYGTVAGFERLDVPYLPHILPTERW